MKNENLATHKEFGKMLRAVADIYTKYGNTPLYDSTPEIKDKVFYVTNRGAYDGYIEPWMKAFAEHPIDVAESIKWAKKAETRDI